MTPQQIATRTAWAHLGRPYIWGGDDPVAGFDCSGFVIELLKSAGALPRDGDWSAAALYERFRGTLRSAPSEGCLAFWRGKGGGIVHVEYCLDEHHAIGASGGTSQNTSLQAAIDTNAYIKVRPVWGRAGLAGFADPFAHDDSNPT